MAQTQQKLHIMGDTSNPRHHLTKRTCTLCNHQYHPKAITPSTLPWPGIGFRINPNHDGTSFGSYSDQNMKYNFFRNSDSSPRKA
jgi:hypothetical protein